MLIYAEEDKEETSTQIVNSESIRLDRWVKNERVAQQRTGFELVRSNLFHLCASLRK